MLNQIVKLINRNADPFVLRVSDFSKAQKSWDFPPAAFLNVFITNWEESRSQKNDLSNINFAKKIITNDENKGVWIESKLFEDENNFKNDDIIEEEFRDKIRGFSDDEVEKKAKYYKDKIRKNLSDLKPIIEFLKKKLDELDKKERGKRLYWNAELNNLLKISQKFENELDESSVVIRAARNLKQDSGFFKNISKFIRSFSDIDISPPFLKTALLDITLDNPYRHLVWIAYPTYTQIQQEWEKSHDKEQCLNILEQYFNVIDNLEKFIEAEFIENRKEILLESINCSKNKNYTAASLLLYTQTEGILFDIAKEINGRSYNGNQLQIFTDINNTNKYTDIAGCEKEFLSIMSILFDSKMRYFLWPGFLEYFASDFYAQRCIYAHGQNSTTLNEFDYKTISLFTLTVLDIYRELRETGKAPSLSECYES